MNAPGGAAFDVAFVLVVVLLAATGLMSGYATASEGAAGAVARRFASSPAMVELVLVSRITSTLRCEYVLGVGPANPTTVASGKKLLTAASEDTALGGGKTAEVDKPAKALARPTLRDSDADWRGRSQ